MRLLTEAQIVNEYYCGNSEPLARWYNSQQDIKDFIKRCAYKYCKGEVSLVEDACQNVWAQLLNTPVEERPEKFKPTTDNLSGAFKVRIKRALMNVIDHEGGHGKKQKHFF
jgi:hypothetical protein